jgi:hypothetical protein
MRPYFLHFEFINLSVYLKEDLNPFTVLSEHGLLVLESLEMKLFFIMNFDADHFNFHDIFTDIPVE